ncbi:MAG: hypothetical protein IJA62_03785 [Ruminococcus sp.]|nr:hypothetical protein [Ruminococcus sp.]
MTEAERILKLGELLKNEAIAQQLSRIKNKKGIQSLFSENGLHMSTEEVEAFVRAMKLSCADELDEADLELATGGSVNVLCVLNKAFMGITNTEKHLWSTQPWADILESA